MIKQASIKFKKNDKQTRNPFDRNQDPDKVYNIVTGLATMDSNQNVLVNVFKSEENEQKKYWRMIVRLSTVCKPYQDGKKLSHLLQKLGNRK